MQEDTGSHTSLRVRHVRWPLIVVGMVIVVAIVAAAVVGISKSARTSRATTKLNSAITLLAGAENTIDAADEVLQAEISVGLETSATAALAGLPAARTSIDRAVALLVQARPDLSPGDQVYAAALQDAAEARSDMLKQAEPVLRINVQAAGALESARLAWNYVASAQKYSDEAVVNFNRHNKGGVTTSKLRTNSALTRLDLANSQLTSVTAVFPDADVSPFKSYVAARTALLKQSLAIDTLWLAGKVDEANAKLSAFAKQEAAVVAQGKKLPGTPTTAIASAYESAATTATDAYFSARDRARAADKKVQTLGRKVAGD